MYGNNLNQANPGGDHLGAQMQQSAALSRLNSSNAATVTDDAQAVLSKLYLIHNAIDDLMARLYGPTPVANAANGAHGEQPSLRSISAQSVEMAESAHSRLINLLTGL